MKALSIRQPWAWLICAGIPEIKPVPVAGRSDLSTLQYTGRVLFKNIENRKWPLPASFTLPQRIFIHAGIRCDNCLTQLLNMGLPAIWVLLAFGKKAARGAIVGEVDIVDCVTESVNPWFTGPYGFVLANPALYEETIPYKGRRGLFEVII